jgi:DNA modification methylase
MNELKIISVPLSEIKPFTKNAKLHPKEQVAQIVASIREYGFNDPIAISEDNEIIEGHGRLLAVKELGYTEVPCIRLSHLTEAQRRAYILAHNKLTMNTGFDTDILLGELAFLKDNAEDISAIGFSGDELDKLFGTDKKDVKDDDFDIDKAVSEPPFVMPGDLWHIGKHTLLCGDSTNPDDVKRLLGGQKVNLVLTDPPYNVNYESKGQKIKNDNMSDEDFHKFLFSAFSQAEAIMAEDASVYVFYADSKGLVFRQAFDEAGFKLASNCVWVKDNFTFGRSDYKWGHEVCLYGWKKTGKHNWFGDMKQSTIWNCPKPKKNDGHPTMKPIPLLAIPVNNSTQTNALVYDPFAGSFSTGVCCEQLGRVAFGMELDPVYASVSVKRMISAIGSSDGVTVERNGEILKYCEVVGNG